MSLRPSLETVVMSAFMVAAPLFAQTAAKPAKSTAATAQTSQTTSTQSNETKPAIPTGKIRGGRYRARTLSASSQARVWSDATRLAAILVDLQANATLSADAWKVSASEANVLAGRIAREASKSARDAAKSAREHVSAMRDAALKGDAAGAKAHAGEALPYVYQVIDASMPTT